MRDRGTDVIGHGERLLDIAAEVATELINVKDQNICNIFWLTVSSIVSKDPAILIRKLLNYLIHEKIYTISVFARSFM